MHNFLWMPSDKLDWSRNGILARAVVSVAVVATAVVDCCCCWKCLSGCCIHILQLKKKLTNNFCVVDINV